MGNVWDKIQTCSVTREKQVGDVIPLIFAKNQKPLVLKYFNQAQKGCGRVACTNQCCASYSNWQQLNTSTSLKTALLYHLKREVLCLPLENNQEVQKPKSILESILSPPPDTPLLQKVTSQYVNNNGVDADFGQVLEAYIEMGESRAQAAILVAHLFATDADEGKGHEKAMFQLARMYMEGIGVPIDMKMAIDLFVKCGLPEDKVIKEVIRNIQQFAYMDNKSACFQVALMFRHGIGVPTISYRQCLRWMVKSGMSLEDASKIVHEWFSQDVKEADVPPTRWMQLSLIYANGVGTEIDDIKALAIAAKQANPYDIKFLDQSKRQETGQEYTACAEIVAKTFNVHRLTPSSSLDGSETHREMTTITADDLKKVDRSFSNLFVADLDNIIETPIETSTQEQVQEQHLIPLYTTIDQSKLSLSVDHDQDVIKDAKIIDVFKLAIMLTNGYGCQTKHEHALTAFKLMGYTDSCAQRFVHDKLMFRTKMTELHAILELAYMNLNYENTMNAIIKSGDGPKCLQEAARLLSIACDKGSKKAASKLGDCYVHGLGVPIDFRLATEFYNRAGKSREYIRLKLDAKIDELKAKYKQVFDIIDADNDGIINDEQFRSFYIVALQSKGCSPSLAVDTADGPYQNKKRWIVLYRKVDSKDAGVSFDTLWNNNETHYAVFALEDQMHTAFQFFAKRGAAIIQQKTLIPAKKAPEST